MSPKRGKKRRAKRCFNNFLLTLPTNYGKLMKNHLVLYTFAVIATIIMMAGCTGSGGLKTTGTPIDIQAVADRVMKLAADRPEQALLAIDSLRAEGLADYEADWFRAKVYCQSLEGARLDSAIAICERLMLLDVARENCEYRQDVLETLVNACRRKNDDTRILRWSAELVTLFHENGDETEALRSEAEMGVALAHTGHLQEGLAKIDSVIAALGGKRKFNELDASLIALKRKVGVLSETGHHTDIIPVAQSMLERLADYEQHPDDYRDGSYREPADEDRAGYIDFYRNRANGYLAEAYVRHSLEFRVESLEKAAATDSARHYLALYEQSGYGLTQAGRRFIVPTLCLLGEATKMDTIFQDLDDARFRSYEQQVEIERKDAETRYVRRITIVLTVVVVLLLTILFLFVRHHRIVRRKNRILAQQIAEALAVKEQLKEQRQAGTPAEVSTDLSALSDADLFHHLSNVIERDKLFLDPACDRQMLTDHFQLSKERIGAAFSHGSDHDNLTAYIRTLRLDFAAQMLTDNPDYDVSQVAGASGFSSPGYFSTCFRKHFGLSPSDFRDARRLQPDNPDEIGNF